MQYNQETLDKIREVMPLGLARKVHQNVNKGRGKEIPYSTVCEVLRTYREGGKAYYRNRRLAVYDESVRLLKEKGINIEQLIKTES